MDEIADGKEDKNKHIVCEVVNNMLNCLDGKNVELVHIRGFHAHDDIASQ